MRQFLGLVLASVSLIGCGGSSPTAPVPASSGVPAGVPIGITILADRTTIPANDAGGAVQFTVTISVQPGTNPSGVPVQLAMTTDGGGATVDILNTNASGAVSKQFNFSKSGYLAASAGGVAHSVRITKQVHQAPVITDPREDDEDDDRPLTMTLTAAPSTDKPNVNEPFTITTSVAMSDGSRPSDLKFEIDHNTDKTYDEVSATGRTAIFQRTESTVGPREYWFRVTQTSTQRSTTARLVVQVGS